MPSISLIANSGIQTYTVPLTIDFGDTDSSLLFHEWNDIDDNEEKLELAYSLANDQTINTFYRRSEMEKYDFINKASGALIVLEREVMINPNMKVLGTGDLSEQQELFEMNGSSNLCMIDSLLDQWLPFPYYENIEDCKGPYNWCRAKIVPLERSNNSMSATLLLAFDTRTEYRQMQDYDECPVFQVDSELEKHYALPNAPSMLLDYTADSNTWVRTGLMQLVHGTDDINQVPAVITQGQQKYAYLATYIWLLYYIGMHSEIPEVNLKRDRGVAGIDVDMVIDIGNSRTAAILYEGDFSKMAPLALQNWTHPLGRDGELNRVEESFDMRVAFQTVDFGHYVVSSRQFIWPSIVRLGEEAQELTFKTGRLAEGDEHYSTYSSPKRYLWDRMRRDKEWRQVRTKADGQHETPSLPGLTGYFEDDGTIEPDGLGSGFHYSRRTLMTLAMIEILAQCRVEINSYAYRSGREHPSKPRLLGKVIITCPTGMSKREQAALHNCLEDAAFVLNQFYSDGDGENLMPPVTIVPGLGTNNHPEWMYDEATCSQFVYLYGLLTETYKNCSGELFETYGRVRPPLEGGSDTSDGQRKSLVIGSLDIGAGTSDIMIARYDAPQGNQSARLKPVPVFWDSFDIAGDDMLRELISNVLIQGPDGILERVMKESAQMGEDEVRGKLFLFFGRNQTDHKFCHQMLRRDFNLQVLVPVMYEFLRLHTIGETSHDVTYRELFGDREPGTDVKNRFREVFGLELEKIVWHFDREVLTRHIVASMDKDLIEKVAGIMYAYGCDIVLLSGRPTSLAPIEDTFLSHAPSFAGRLVAMNRHHIGDWYPFIDKAHRCINNSKSIVPVGAIIGYLASTGGGLNGFSIDVSELAARLTPTTNYFVERSATRNPSFMGPTDRTGVITVKSLPVYIGARQFDLDMYPMRPFYVLTVDRKLIAARILGGEPELTEREVKNRVDAEVGRIMNAAPLNVTLERPDFAGDKETLRIINIVSSTGNRTVATSGFTLSLQSLNDPDCYWLDSGIFDINIGIGRS